jgi:hypothetical protein
MASSASSSVFFRLLRVFESFLEENASQSVGPARRTGAPGIPRIPPNQLMLNDLEERTTQACGLRCCYVVLYQLA